MEITQIREHINNKLGVNIELEEDEVIYLLEFAINNIMALGVSPLLSQQSDATLN